MATQQGKRPTNIEKDKRSWWLSHEVFLLIQALADQLKIDPVISLEVTPAIWPSNGFLSGSFSNSQFPCGNGEQEEDAEHVRQGGSAFQRTGPLAFWAKIGYTF